MRRGLISRGRVEGSKDYGFIQEAILCEIGKIFRTRSLMEPEVVRVHLFAISVQQTPRTDNGNKLSGRQHSQHGVAGHVACGGA